MIEFDRSNGGLMASLVRPMACRSANQGLSVKMFCNHGCLTRLRFCLAEVLLGLMACCFVWIMSFGLGQGRSLVSWVAQDSRSTR